MWCIVAGTLGICALVLVIAIGDLLDAYKMKIKDGDMK